MTTTRTKTRWVAVSGTNDRTFRTYAAACAWLDDISPETATAGFETEDGETDDNGTVTTFVRHVRR